MKIFNNSGYHVATLSLVLTDDGPRYCVEDRYYERRRSPRRYKTLEQAIATTQKRLK